MQKFILIVTIQRGTLLNFFRIESVPEWFLNGMKAVQLAPSSMNHQKFTFELDGDIIHTKSGSGFYTKIDLSIAKCHFEIGAGEKSWNWSYNL